VVAGEGGRKVVRRKRKEGRKGGELDVLRFLL